MMEMARTHPLDAAALDPEAELVARARAGDRDAFEQLFRRHYRQVYAVACRVLPNATEAEDVVQDAFVRAYGALGGFRGEAAFSTWVCRIAINIALRRARRLRAQPASLTEVPEGGPAQEPADAADLECLVEQRAEAHAVRQAVSGLPDKHRVVIALRYFEGYSCDEIARLLGCSVGTVWSRLFHAHRKLRARLGSAGKEAP
jgi:RNA polymerase sigma-70 factor (ECF subfamily)